MVLNAEIRWLLEGSAAEITMACAALAGFCYRLSDEQVEVSFGNSVGLFPIGPAGNTIEVVSGKWGRRDFAAMLEDVTRVAAALPFAADHGGALPYDRSLAAREDLLYHAFIYLRHILIGDGRPETQLLPALALIRNDPHRVWLRTTAMVPVEEARWVDPSSLQRLVQGREPLMPVGALDMPLARALGGHLPERVEELRVRTTFDTPENRFVKSFLRSAEGIVDAMRTEARPQAEGGRGLQRRVMADCDEMSKALARVRREGRWLWDAVGRMTYLPAGSTVLQMRRGYRQVLGHFARLRVATRLPLSKHDARQLLELKDIALLYELWTYFYTVEALTAHLGPPIQALSVQAAGVWTKEVRQGMVVIWRGGVRLQYNPTYSPRSVDRRSYSVPLRPDIALTVPDGPGEGLHLLDAKFRLRRLTDLMGAEARETAGGTDDDPLDVGFEAEERRGTFKRADLYKMHTYRDAIPGARSVWALYPGDEARFFPVNGQPAEIPADAASLEGVGAIPLSPRAGGGERLDLLVGVMFNRVGRDGARVALGKTREGRYLRVIDVQDSEPDSVFVITAYDLAGKALTAYRRRRQRKGGQ